MRTRREAEGILRADPGLPGLRSAIAKAKSALEKRRLFLPDIPDTEGIDGLSRLVFLASPALAPDETAEIRKAAAGLLSRAFSLDPGVSEMLLGHGLWDCHVSTTSGFFIPEMRSSGLFDALRMDGGNALFLAGGIGQEALEFLKGLGLEPGNKHVRASILEKDPRYALVSQMRGVDLLFGRPASLEECWGMKCPPVDVIFLSFPTPDLDFRHTAIQMDAALRRGGMAILLGNLDFAGGATGYLGAAGYTKLANPPFCGRMIDDEFLQIHRKS